MAENYQKFSANLLKLMYCKIHLHKNCSRINTLLKRNILKILFKNDTYALSYCIDKKFMF